MIQVPDRRQAEVGLSGLDLGLLIRYMLKLSLQVQADHN